MAWNTKESLFALSGATAVLSLLVIRLEWKLRKILRGGKTERLDETLGSIERELKFLQSFRNEAAARLRSAEERLMRTIQGIGLVRFYPFKGGGEGGNQSFALSLIDPEGDGIVVSSLSTRDRLILFTKPVSQFKPESALSEEERESLEKAAAALPKRR